MALDNEYFDSINLEIAKKKYYNANKVQAVLNDIRSQAIALSEENETLKARLDEVSKVKGDISEALLSAKTVSRSLIAEATGQAGELVRSASEQADAIVRAAEEKAAVMIAEAESRAAEERARIQNREAELTEHYRTALERMKSMQLQFLDELDEELETFGGETAAEVPADLEQKIGAIADKLFSIENEE